MLTALDLLGLLIVGILGCGLTLWRIGRAAYNAHAKRLTARYTAHWVRSALAYRAQHGEVTNPDHTVHVITLAHTDDVIIALLALARRVEWPE